MHVLMHRSLNGPELFRLLRPGVKQVCLGDRGVRVRCSRDDQQGYLDVCDAIEWPENFPLKSKP